MAKTRELCGSTFDERVCTKPKGHHGKHEDDREGHWQMWTEAGKARVEKERAENIPE
jgi:hypothetical protein